MTPEATANQLDLCQATRKAMPKTRGLTMLAFGSHLVLDFNCCVRRPIPQAAIIRCRSKTKAVQLIGELSKSMMRELATEIYKNIKPWLDKE